MKRIILIIGAAIIALTSHPADAQVQRTCGTALKYQQMAVENPALYRQVRERQQKATAEALANANSAAAKQTSVQYPIPVVFHFILTTAQWNSVGNDSGIKRRVYSQLKGLNEDYNRKNADSLLIPSAFKSRYTSVNIQFGLANVTNSNTISPGIEVKVLPAGNNPVYDVNVDCYTAKEATAVGFPSWDVTKYLNVWIVNITSGGSGTILGITTSPTSVGYSAGSHVITAKEVGVVLNYGAIGVREYAAQYFVVPFDKGRTLTHEIGHYFELFHTWGDDDDADAAGHCPGDMSGGIQVGWDDGIADTPPQARRTYCDYPNHTGSACPTFPLLDACSAASPGVMYMNYMDYTDDRSMQMFTTQQGQVMRNQIASGGESFTLTQSPNAIVTAVPSVSETAFRIFPNPAKDAVHVVLGGSEKLLSIDVLNIMGQSISHVVSNNGSAYDMQLGNTPRGIYFVQCHFAEGTLTKKIVLE